MEELIVCLCGYRHDFKEIWLGHHDVKEGYGWGLLEDNRRQSLGRVPTNPGPSGSAGDAGVDTSYRGGMDPDSVTNVGLEAEGGSFRSSHHGWCSVMCKVGSV